MKRALIVLLIVGGIGAVAGGYYIRRGSGDLTVNTAPLTRGDVIDSVGATGTLQAVTTVQVGSQVSGNISWLGADFNSIVHKDQVIARIDPSIFQAQVEQAKANLVKSRADVIQGQANVEHAKVALTDADQKFERQKTLNARGLVAQADLDAAQIAVDSAKAELNSAQAALNSSQAQVAQAQASVNQNQVNLEHCIITAPIDGIVIQRSVDVGQTVAASLQSPTLFIIAADLTKMQVNANIDEADVGRIRPGQTATFRVDAYPNDEFQGNVSQIRLQPIVVQNVTTYGTIIDVPNTDLRLKPGMTANLKVQIAKRGDVVRVPNAALRFRPTAEMFDALNQTVPPELQFGGRNGRTMAGGQRGGAGTGGSPTATTGTPNGGAPGGATTDASGAAPGAGDRRAQMLERFKSMSPDEQKQFIDRMKGRGMDVSAFEAAAKPAPPAEKAAIKTKYGAQQSPETIDALFGPLPPVESSGRIWMFVNHELKSVRVRLGVTDGTNTELLGNDLQPGTELVTGLIVPGAARRTTTGSGNPLMGPQRGPGGMPRR